MRDPILNAVWRKSFSWTIKRENVTGKHLKKFFPECVSLSIAFLWYAIATDWDFDFLINPFLK